MRLVRYSYLFFVFLITALACPGSQQSEHSVPQHSFSNVEKYARMFESPERKKWQKPDEVVKKMNLQNGDTVADIGAGTGYFTRRFGQAVSPDGAAIGYDLEPNMVEYMKKDAKKRGIDNYRAKVVDAQDPDLPPNAFEVIFLCNTYHHIQDRVDYFKDRKKNLKPAGRLIIVDFKKEASGPGPAKKHKLAKKNVIKELEKAGYKLIKEENFLPHQYYLEFQKN